MGQKSAGKEERRDGPGTEKTLLEIVGGFLTHVFWEDDFLVGLDCTGVYLFTECGSDDGLQGKVDRFTQDLDLEKGQVSLCVVGRKSKFNYCSRKLIGKYVMSATKSRKPVLSNAEIEDILKLYGVDTQNRHFGMDFSGTGLFKQLVAVANDHGAEVALSEINGICRDRPDSIAALRGYGVPEGLLMEFQQCIANSEPEKAEVLHGSNAPVETKVLNGGEHLPIKMLAKEKWLMVALCVASCLLLPFCGAKIWWLPILPAAVSVFIGCRVGDAGGKNAAVKLVMLLSCLSMAFCLAGAVMGSLVSVRAVWGRLNSEVGGSLWK